MGCGQSSLSPEEIITPHKLSQKQSFNTHQTTDINPNHNPPVNPSNPVGKKPNSSKQKLTKQQISLAYDKVKGNLQKLFQQLSQRISQYYMQLSVEAVQLMCDHKMNQIQTKVYLSQQFLLLSFEILKVIGEKSGYEYSIDVFKIFNKSQNVLISYLKEKYPRAGNIFVPGDLMQVFKEFNMVDSPQNDILRKAKISFIDPSDQQIIKNLKILFNTLIEQLDAKFPIFQNLLQQKIFYYEVQGKRKSLNYKIGRKLPENTAKYQLDQYDQLTITSPQVFRMIIKWVTEMQELLNTPEDQISDKSSYKAYSVQKDGIYYDEVTSDQCQDLLENLMNKLKDLKLPFKQEMDSLLKQQDMFNVNLVKILFTTERKQKFVPTNQANVIKYTMYNTKVVSWLLAEKLIKVLKNLINVGIQMDKTSLGRRVDLVKFAVKDLFRSMVVGTKKEILSVYKNLRDLEAKGDLKIIQIRNRLGTPLNDAMIIFTFKESFMICQLQLILSQGQGISDKVKSLQVMNHFLYEMVRSPYGVLSEVAVLLGYKDNKINYEDKITFINKTFDDFQHCQQKHPDCILNQKIQKKPFICTQCTQFYHPYESIFGLKYCKKCFDFQCCRCSFSKSKDLEQSQIDERFIQHIQCELSEEKNRKNGFNSLSKAVTAEDILKCFYKKKFFIKNIIKKHYQKLQPKDIHAFIKKKEYNEQLGYPQGPYFIYVQFKGINTNVKMYYWNENLEQIQNSMNQKENFYQIQKIGSSYYDFILFVDSSKCSMLQYRPAQIQQKLKFCLRSQIQYQTIKKLKAIKIPIKLKQNDAILLTKIQTNLPKDDTIQNQQQSASKKQFLFSSIADARKSLPNVALVQEIFQMKNYGITTPLLNEYLLKNKQTNKMIKTLNLNKNKITDISVLLSQCINVDSIMVSKNYLKSLKFVTPLKNLTKLILSQNKIGQITGLSNIPSIRKLNLSENSLTQLQPMNHKNLRQFTISFNSFQSFSWLEKSILPELETLNADNTLKPVSVVGYKFQFPRLKTLKYNGNQSKSLTLKCPELKFLQCPYCSLTLLNLQNAKVQQLTMNSNIYIQNLQQILVSKCEKVKVVNASDSGKLNTLPKLNLEQIQTLNLSSCQIKDITNLGNSNLPKLKQLLFNYNTINTFPQVNLPNLKIIQLEGIQLKNLEIFAKNNFKLLEILYIYGNAQNQIQECPRFRFPSLKTLKMENFKIKNMLPFAESSLPKIQDINFSYFFTKQMPKLQFDSLKNLTLSHCNMQNFTLFNETNLKNLVGIQLNYLNEQQTYKQIPQQNHLKSLNCPSVTYFNCYGSNCINFDNLLANKPLIQTITWNSMKIQNFPQLMLPLLKSINVNSCKMQNIGNLTLSQLPNLEQLYLQYNQIQAIPKISFPKLRVFHACTNKITNLKSIDQSKLPLLEELDVSCNQIQEFPVLKLQSLKKLTIHENPMKSFKGLAKSKLNNLQLLYLSNFTNLVDKVLPVLNLPKLTSLQFSTCNLQSIDNLEKSNLPNLVGLTFQYVQIQSLPILKLPKLNNFTYQGNYFYGQQTAQNPKPKNLKQISNLSKWQCPNLQRLSLRQTLIQSLPRMNLPQLTHIQLSNSLTNMEQLKNSHLPQLESINFTLNSKLGKIDLVSGCLLDEINFSFCCFQGHVDFAGVKSRCFNVSNNKIKSIGKIDTKDIEDLNLQFNQLTDISSWLTESPKLQNLFLQNNQLTSFPQVEMPSLSYLNLQNNNLTYLSLPSKYFPNIQSILLNNNKLQKITEISTNQLQYLQINNNKLKVVDFFKRGESSSKMYSLQLQNNEIERIDYLPHCSTIYLQGNRIKNLDWIAACNSQKWSNLYLNQNCIQDISGLNKGCKLNNLYYFQLNNNKIKNLNLTTVRFPLLNFIDFTGNQIQIVDKIPAECFPTLSQIVFSENKIKKFGPSVNFFKVDNFVINNNPELEALDGLNGFNINQISITGCNIKSLNWLAKINCPRLSNLQLTNNKIKVVPKLSNFPKLFALEIGQNPLQDISGFLSQFNQLDQTFTLTYKINPDWTIQQKKSFKQKVDQKIKVATCQNQQINPDYVEQQQVQQNAEQIDPNVNLNENGNENENKNENGVLHLDDQGNQIRGS